MSTALITIIALASPVMFLVVALISTLVSDKHLPLIKVLSIVAALTSIGSAIVLLFVIIKNGAADIDLFVVNGIGLSLRFDALSICMLTVIALISFVVIKFSLNYLEGDARHSFFIGQLAATIIAVQFFVLSNNLGVLLTSWILTSVFLHRLLLFYSERRGAAIAARKKFIIARIGDACLLAAFILLYKQFGTGDLKVIFDHIKVYSIRGLPGNLELAAVLLALAAILKSAQFPTHGWLIEVMETPTPVSALLHAGLLNAGPFLIIRMSFLIHGSNYAPPLLIAVGGFTALFASTVYLTQTSVKTALSYSSVAHMGFSLFVSGMGVFPAAMLHLVAHSFYKAHAFLSSGSAMEVLSASKISSVKRIGSPIKIISGITIAIGFYTITALIWGVDMINNFSLFTVGAIMIMGLSRILASASDVRESNGLMLRACVLAFLVSVAFFSLETLSSRIFQGQLAETGSNSFTANVLISVLLTAFAVIVIIQIIAPMVSSKKQFQIIGLHIRNGLYINAVFDRIIGALKVRASQSLVVQNTKSNLKLRG